MAKIEIIDEQYLLAISDAPRPGGMSEVRKAFDVINGNQPVAIKFFREDIVANRHHLEAYSREQRILQEIDHPHIVKLLGGGKVDGGRRYLVLEWLEKSLQDRLLDTPYTSWDQFMQDVGNPLLEALSHLYINGILHRDIKPANILMDEHGVAKLADFGISKLKNLAAPAVTVSRFRSEPFSPPEVDDGLHSETRDVFGFAAIVLACFSKSQLVTYEDIYGALSRFVGPPGVGRILEKALDRDPGNRYSNIIELKIAIDEIESKRLSLAKAKNLSKCYYKLDPKVESDILSLRADPSLNYQNFVASELSDIWGIAPARNASSPFQFSIFCTQFMYRAEVDATSRAYIRITRAIPFQPSVLEQYREEAWSGDICFCPMLTQQAPLEGQKAVSMLIEGVAENELAVVERKRSALSEELFRKWNASMLAKRDVEANRMAPIQFRDAIADGQRLKLYVDDVLDQDLKEKQVKVEFSQGLTLYGEVEEVLSNSIVVWSELFELGNVPKSGILTLDARAAHQAISRQRTALDAVRFGRAVRKELRELLVSPSEAKLNEVDDCISFSQEALDESKQDAVRRALAADSFLVVEGPPGTGKTRFITEVVVQTLKKNPSSKILISSQTHVALDNALDRIRNVAPDVRLTRIGRKDDPRVSPDVSDMLLDNRVEDWLKVVKARSEKFLEGFSETIGVDPKEISLEIGVARVRVAFEDKVNLEKTIAEHERELAELLRQDRELEAKEQSDTYHELKEAIREITETLKRLSHEMKLARDNIKRAKRHLGTLPGGDTLKNLDDNGLMQWEINFVNRDIKTRIIKDLLQLSEEWYLRFGRSADFHAALLSDSEVIAGTCLGFAGTRGMDRVEFDLCIIDEASKATVTELLVPMVRAKKWILVGDRKQLPPFIDDALEDPKLLEKYNYSVDDLSVSLLEILIEKLPSGCVSRLTHQHRMTRQIGDLISSCFYEGTVISGLKLPNEVLHPALSKPVTWLSTSASDARHEKRAGRSFINSFEIEVIRKQLRKFSALAASHGKTYSVAILTGYASQRWALQRMIDSEFQNLNGLQILCNTVDAFQGKEADIAIYSVTRSNNNRVIGFLRDLRRLNVALSRAKLGLVVVGDSAFLRTVKGVNPWIGVLDYIESHPDDCEILYKC